MRGLSAGIEPMIPLRHCATTSAGVEAMNIGPAITGNRSLLTSRGADRDRRSRLAPKDASP